MHTSGGFFTMYMKKVMMILACLVMSASIYAQDITGKWFQTNSAVEEGTEVNYVDTLTLAPNKSFSDVVMFPDFITFGAFF